jgi:protein-tyrosine phosphatase
MSMVDLHNHILPGVDDGARDLDDALTMARQAVAQGTSIMAATPHRYYQSSEMHGSVVEDAVHRLQRSLDRHQIPLRIVAGIELPMKPDTLDLLRDGRLIPIGGHRGKFVLIEPPFNNIPPTAIPLLEGIQSLRMTPIVAHPERNSEIQRDLTFLETCAERGMILQVTAGAVIGKFGPKPEACAREIVQRRDWKIILASDAHDTFDRTPGDMSAAVARIAEWINDEPAARHMATTLPHSLIPPGPG